MEKLSYLATFISLIYGLAVANVLAHLAWLIKPGRRADWYWVHSIWSLFLLLLMATMWWNLQSWDGASRIGYLNYLSLLFSPSILFVASDVLFPDRQMQGTIDLKAHFFAIKHRLFLLMIALAAADQLDSLLKGWRHIVELGPVYWGTQACWYITSLVGIRTRSERLLGALACTSLLLLVFSGYWLATGQ